MQPTPAPRGRSRLIAALLAASLAGCSDSYGPASDLTGAETADVGVSVVEESEAGVDALGLDAALNPALATGASWAMSASVSEAPDAQCATVSSTVDTDGDGVRDNTTYTYTVPPCSFTGPRGGTVELTGVVEVSDPSPTVPGFAYQVELTDFAFKLTAPNGEDSYTATRNGVRTLTANGGGLALSNQMTVVRTFPSRPDATASHNLLLTFTPEQGASLVQGEPLPSGDIALSGTVSWTRGDNTRNFNVTTVTPLEYDASCDGPRRNRIKAGEIRWTLPSGAYLSFVWSACGARPTRTYVPA